MRRLAPAAARSGPNSIRFCPGVANRTAIQPFLPALAGRSTSGTTPNPDTHISARPCGHRRQTRQYPGKPAADSGAAEDRPGCIYQIHQPKRKDSLWQLDRPGRGDARPGRALLKILPQPTYSPLCRSAGCNQGAVCEARSALLEAVAREGPTGPVARAFCDRADRNRTRPASL